MWKSRSILAATLVTIQLLGVSCHISESYDICEKRCVYKKDRTGTVCKHRDQTEAEEETEEAEIKACQCGQFTVPSLVQENEFSGYCVPILPLLSDCQERCEATDESVDISHETVSNLSSLVRCAKSKRVLIICVLDSIISVLDFCLLELYLIALDYMRTHTLESEK